jgi:hypothetical protein
MYIGEKHTDTGARTRWSCRGSGSFFLVLLLGLLLVIVLKIGDKRLKNHGLGVHHWRARLPALELVEVKGDETIPVSALEEHPNLAVCDALNDSAVVVVGVVGVLDEHHHAGQEQGQLRRSWRRGDSEPCLLAGLSGLPAGRRRVLSDEVLEADLAAGESAGEAHHLFLECIRIHRRRRGHRSGRLRGRKRGRGGGGRGWGRGKLLADADLAVAQAAAAEDFRDAERCGGTGEADAGVRVVAQRRGAEEGRGDGRCHCFAGERCEPRRTEQTRRVGVEITRSDSDFK